MMLYSIIEVNDQATKDQLVETCDHQPFIATAPWVLLFLADYQRWYDYFSHCDVEGYCESQASPMLVPEEGDLLLACCDSLIAAQTAVLAAESLGLGSCYIGDILENYEIHQEMFALPPYAIPIALLCLGYPTEDQRQRQLSTRFDPEFIVYQDRYRRLNGEEFDEMFAQRTAKVSTQELHSPNMGIAMYKRKFSAEYAIEMRRSVAAMLQSWKMG
jgi:FMN reductase (NADPH)/FMN reductase [NAD(P)H]